MPCNGPELQTLIVRDVNASKPTSLSATQDQFELEQPDLLVSCEEQKDPFAVFCNIPQPRDNDTLVSMCNLAQQTDEPDSYFQRLVRGQVSQLDQMATLWESARFAKESQDDWVEVPNTTLQTFLPNENYLGFDLFAVNDMSVSDNAQQLLAVRNGSLYQSCPDGFIHAVPDPLTESGFLQGSNSANQSTTISPRGFVRAALFADKFFFYGNGQWQPDLTPQLSQKNVVYQSMKMWIDTKTKKLLVAIFYSFVNEGSRQAWSVDVFSFVDTAFGNAASAFLEPIASIPSPLLNTNPFYTGFLTIQPDNGRLYWSTMLRLGTADPFIMHVYSASTEDFVLDPNMWFLQLPQPFAHFNQGQTVVYTGALANGSIQEQTTKSVTLLFVVGTNMFQAVLEFGNVVVSLHVITRALRALSLHESLDHSRLMFALDNKLRISCDLDVLTVVGQTFSLDDNDLYYAYVFALAPTTGTDIWIIRNRRLYRLHNTDPKEWGSLWTFDFTMMFAQHARIDDFGLPTLEKDIYVPTLASRWYLGTVTRAQEPNVGGAKQPFPFEVARSAHQTFRYAVTNVLQTAIGLPTFPHAVGQLQRANEYILSNKASTVSVDNDSNVSMMLGSKLMWESNTHDRVSVQDGIVRLRNMRSEPFAICSNNGLYLLYKIPDRNRLRLIFNPFNASRMTTWCAPDPDRFNQALQMQQNMCWNHLKIPDSDLFADSRCTCIGGAALFDIVMPGVQYAPNTLAAPFAEVLPCFTSTCLFGTNGAFETETNVSKFATSRCSNRIINVVTNKQVIDKSNLINGGFEIFTDAGINRGMCSDLEPCDPGNTCQNGRCVVKCTTNKECQQLFGLTHSSCVRGTCSGLVQPASFTLSWWVILALVCFVVLIIMILLFAAIATIRKK